MVQNVDKIILILMTYSLFYKTSYFRNYTRQISEVVKLIIICIIIKYKTYNLKVHMYVCIVHEHHKIIIKILLAREVLKTCLNFSCSPHTTPLYI
ncbi:hypothetical protein HanIR_Chr01g0018761 [Helianthus annuus]|nr:hypothetical protein HanIR_Chr01g0018761 [Helianthus annuus]